VRSSSLQRISWNCRLQFRGSGDALDPRNRTYKKRTVKTLSPRSRRPLFSDGSGALVSRVRDGVCSSRRSPELGPVRDCQSLSAGLDRQADLLRSGHRLKSVAQAPIGNSRRHGPRRCVWGS
jgi:hypothetical protein